MVVLAAPASHRSLISHDQPRPFLEVLRNMLRQDGPRSLFKGWTPAFVRLAPNTVLMFVFLEVRKCAHGCIIEMSLHAIKQQSN